MVVVAMRNRTVVGGGWRMMRRRRSTRRIHREDGRAGEVRTGSREQAVRSTFLTVHKHTCNKVTYPT